MNADRRTWMGLVVVLLGLSVQAEPVVLEVEVVPGAGWRSGNGAEKRSVPLAEVPGLGTATLAMDRRHVRIDFTFEEGVGGPNSTVLLPSLPEDVPVTMTWKIDGAKGLLLESVGGVMQRDPDARFERRWEAPDPAILSAEALGGDGAEVLSARITEPGLTRRARRLDELEAVLGRSTPPSLPVMDRLGEVLFEEAFAADGGLPADWTLEGPADAAVRGERLEIRSNKPDAVHPDHGHSVVWAPVELPASGYVVDWTFTPLSDAGLAIVFFDARPNQRGVDDLFDPALPERSGDFKHYVAGALDSYHVSYFATVPFNPGRGNSNLRKNKGLVMMAVGPMAEATPGEPIAMRLIRDGDRIRLLADGEVVMDATDDDRDRFGASLRGGRLGFRQMQWAEAAYDDVVVRRLKSADRAAARKRRRSAAPTRTRCRPATTFTFTGSGGDELAIVRDASPDPQRLPGPRPALETFHGGGRVGGTPVQFRAPAEALAERGIVTLSARIA